jgi:hypothetical protein
MVPQGVLHEGEDVVEGKEAGGFDLPSVAKFLRRRSDSVTKGSNPI